MGLFNRLSELMKSGGQKEKEAEATQEASAEQKLQKIFNTPTDLYKLCLALTPEDQLKFFKLCEAIKSGKLKLDQLNSKMKSSDLLCLALKSKENSENKQARLKKLAQMNTKAKQLLQESFTNPNLRSEVPKANQRLKEEVSFDHSLSNNESTMAWGVLMAGLVSGRIQDVSQVQQISIDAQIDYKKKKQELGLVVSSQVSAHNSKGSR